LQLSYLVTRRQYIGVRALLIALLFGLAQGKLPSSGSTHLKEYAEELKGLDEVDKA